MEGIFIAIFGKYSLLSLVILVKLLNLGALSFLVFHMRM